MRVESWNPNIADQTFENVAVSRLLSAAYVVKDATVRKLRSRIGEGKTTGISRPVYKTGKYANQPWTARDFGQLLRSVRVTKKETKTGKALWRKRNVRIYAGNYLAYYADIFEFSKPFMRPALASSLSEVKEIIGAK